MRVAATKPGDICWRRGVRYELYSSFAHEMYVFEVQLNGPGRLFVHLNASDAAEVGYLSQMLADDCASGGDFCDLRYTYHNAVLETYKTHDFLGVYF